MKRFFLFVAFFLFAVICFHKAILGAAARWTLRAQADCEMAYHSLNWEKGELVFSDIVLFDPHFHTHIEKAVLRFDWSSFPKKLKGHIAIDHPHISLIHQRALPELKNSWLDFSFSVNDGTLEWGGLAHFSFDQNQLAIRWDASAAILTFCDGEIEAEFAQFRATLLKPFLTYGAILDGQLTGRVCVGPNQSLLSANLKMERLGIVFPLGSIENGEGTLSYHANLGAKWEMRGVGSAQAKQFPFLCQGRGFFKSHWIESEIQSGDAWCKITGEKVWKLACHKLQSAQATLLQACSGKWLPLLDSWTFIHGSLNGEVTFSSDFWSASFEGTDLSLCKDQQIFSCKSAVGNLSQEGGHFKLVGDQFDLNWTGTWTAWEAEARVLSCTCIMHGGWDGEKFPVQIEKGNLGDFRFSGRGWIDSNLNFSFGLDGNAQVFQKQIPFHCPNLSKLGSDWTFDFRFVRKTWDIFRLMGAAHGEEVVFDPKSHLLGVPLHFAPCPLGEIDGALHLPWTSVLAAGLFLKEWGIDAKQIPFSEDIDLRFQYKNGQSDIHAQGAFFTFHAAYIEEKWDIDLVSDLTVHSLVKKDGNVKGKANWKTGLEVEFDGHISPDFRCELSLPKVRVDLAQIDFYKMNGIVEGQGHLIYNDSLELDCDFLVSSLKVNSLPIENGGPIHLFYSSLKGALLRGVNLHGPLYHTQPETWIFDRAKTARIDDRNLVNISNIDQVTIVDSSEFSRGSKSKFQAACSINCVVDLLEYDAASTHWIFHNAQVHLPGSFLTHRFLQFLDKDHDLDFTADLDFASDLSTFACTMREGLIPFDGASHPIENLHLFWEDGDASLGAPKCKCKAALHYLNQLHRIHFTVDDKIEGRFILGEEENPLTIDWEYRDTLAIQAIEGSFGGVEASFHAESASSLIGSARVNFTTLSQFFPSAVSKVFNEIKMGMGYELKGRLKMEKNIPYFHGILAGKQLELFGFQFRTLLAQVDLGPERILIYDVKISDTAGMMKIDEILLEGKKNTPWTIAIPQLTMLDFRPSLLQKPGGLVGPISPLVVRELKITDFKGLLDDGKTYRANGTLHFINSYKRGETVFDLPVNVLSRIVGLDLELLVPVCGDLDFHLKDGLFTLQDLTHAFSEGNRSEFFLETTPPPTMDLNGNLNIFVKMKQFVLLKITESFLISINGNLDDPRFHLQKRRFFGLL